MLRLHILCSLTTPTCPVFFPLVLCQAVTAATPLEARKSEPPLALPHGAKDCSNTWLSPGPEPLVTYYPEWSYPTGPCLHSHPIKRKQLMFLPDRRVLIYLVVWVIYLFTHLLRCLGCKGQGISLAVVGEGRGVDGSVLFGNASLQKPGKLPISPIHSHSPTVSPRNKTWVAEIIRVWWFPFKRTCRYMCLCSANIYIALIIATILSTLQLLTHLTYGSFVWMSGWLCSGHFSSGGHWAVPSGPPLRGYGPSWWHSLGRGRSSDRKLNMEVNLKLEKWFLTF